MAIVETRENSIDFLRFIGISLIVLAHVDPPNWLQQLRCFDVPLMVFVSGLTFSGKSVGTYGSFYLRRCTRLVFPVWIFLILYLSVTAIAQTLNLIPHYLTWRMVFESFVFSQGIGYVWIIKVFLLIMLATPFLIWVENSFKSNVSFLGITMALLLVNEVLIAFSMKYEFPVFSFLIDDYISYLLGYSVLFLVGLRMRYLDWVNRGVFFVFYGLCVLVLFGFSFFQNNVFSGITTYKYPPQICFLTYGLMMCCLLWIFEKKFSLIRNRFMLFIARNTIWIYLYHIPFVLFVNEFIDCWVYRYFVCYALAVLFYVLQYYVSNRFLRNKKIFKYLIG